MTEDITVVCECDVLDEARSMGYRRYADMHAAMVIESWPVHYTEHGSWDSHILPTLRCLAGYGDRGYGTYQQRQDIALIQDGDEADMPTDAIILDSSHLLDDVIDAWCNGAHTAVTDTLRQSDEYSLEDIER
jgi:hypothetical protein